LAEHPGIIIQSLLLDRREAVGHHEGGEGTVAVLWLLEPAPQGHTVFRLEREVCAHDTFLSERGDGQVGGPRTS
jgi:hypothetical protein